MSAQLCRLQNSATMLPPQTWPLITNHSPTVMQVLCGCPGRLGQREKLAFLSILLKNSISRERFHGCVLVKAASLCGAGLRSWGTGAGQGVIEDVSLWDWGIEEGFAQPSMQPAGISLLTTRELVLSAEPCRVWNQVPLTSEGRYTVMERWNGKGLVKKPSV